MDENNLNFIDFDRLRLIMDDFFKANSSSSINFLQDLEDFNLHEIYSQQFPLKSLYYSNLKKENDEEILNYFNFDKK